MITVIYPTSAPVAGKVQGAHTARGEGVFRQSSGTGIHEGGNARFNSSTKCAQNSSSSRKNMVKLMMVP